MSSEVWLAILSLISTAIAAAWVVVKVIIPQIVEARLDEARDRREHQQTLEETEATSAAAQRDANQRLTLTLNQNIIGTLERSMAEATMANEAIRDRFFNRLDIGLNHVYSELDSIRLEMRRMDANYSDLTREQHLYGVENQNILEERLVRLSDVVGQIVILLQAVYQVDLPGLYEGKNDRGDITETE